MTNKKPLLTAREIEKIKETLRVKHRVSEFNEGYYTLEECMEAGAHKFASKLSSPELREKIDKILWQPIEWIQASKGGDMLPNGKLPYYLATNYKDKKVDEILSLIKQED